MPKTATSHYWYNFPNGPYCCSFFDDFTDEYATGPLAASSPWIGGSAIASGTVLQTTDAAFGRIVIANTAAGDNSGSQIQQDVEWISLQPGTEVQYLTKHLCITATADAWFSGISITDLTLVTVTAGKTISSFTASDAIGFFSPNDEATVYLAVNKDAAVQSMMPVGTTTANVDAVWAFKILMDPSVAGKGRIIAYKDGLEVGIMDSTDLPDSGESANELCCSAAYIAGAAVSGGLSIDYIGCLVTR